MNENLNVYSSYGLGVSKEIIPGLTIGAKFKLLNGIANVTTNKFQFDWHVADTDTSTYDYTFKGDIDMNTSVPFKIHPVYDENGHISDIKTEAEQYFEDIEEDPALIKDLFRQENTGFAVDLGFIYNINKKIEISGSILDLGYINWKTNAMNIYAKEFQYNFSGVDISKYVNDLEIAQNLSDKEARDSILENIKDDILDTVFALTDPTFDSTITSYNKRLNSKIYLGFSYSPTNWFTLGLLYNGYIYNKKLFSNYAVSGTLLFWKGWSYTLSYTVFKHSYNNIGMGLSYKVGPFQMYLMMNNIAVPFFAGRYAMYPDKPYDEGIATKWVKNSRWLNLQFGINFTFGCKDQRDYGLLD